MFALDESVPGLEALECLDVGWWFHTLMLYEALDMRKRPCHELHRVEAKKLETQ